MARFTESNKLWVYIKGRNKCVLKLLSNLFVVVLFSSFTLIITIMGIHFAAEGIYEGVYTLLVLAYYYYFLGYTFWKLWSWKWDSKLLTLFSLGSSLLILYGTIGICFGPFSYSGSAAVFHALTAICAGMIIHYIDTARNRIYYFDLLEILTDPDLKNDQYRSELESKSNQSKIGIYFKIILISVFYFAFSVGYCILVLFRAETPHKGIGFISTAVILFTDIFVTGMLQFVYCLILFTNQYCLACLETIKKERRHPLFATTIILIPRLCCCFLPDYWILTHYTAISLVLVVLFGLLCFQFFDLYKLSETREQFGKIMDKIQEGGALMEIIERNKIKVPDEEALIHFKEKKDRNLLMFLVFFIAYLLSAIGYGVFTFWGSHYKYARPKVLNFSSTELTQRRLFFMYAITILSCCSLSVWFKLLKVTVENRNLKTSEKERNLSLKEKSMENYVLKKRCMFLFITGGTIIIFVIFCMMLSYCEMALDEIYSSSKVFLIVSYGVAPVLFMSGSIFYFYFTCNNFHFYKRNKLKHLKKRRKVYMREQLSKRKSRLNSVDRRNRLESSDETSQDKSVENVNVEKDDVQRSLMESLFPNGFDDWVIVLSLTINIVSLTIAFVISVSVYSPKRVSVILFNWIMIGEFGSFAFLNLYNSHYCLINRRVIGSLIIVGANYLNSLGFGIFMMVKESDGQYRDATYVSVLISHAILFPVIMFYLFFYLPLKHKQTNANIKERVNFKINPRLIVIVPLGVYLGLGAFTLIIFWGLYASGAGGILISIYLMIYYSVFDLICCKEKFPSQMKRTIILTGVMLPIFASTITILLIFIDNKSEAILEILSLTIYSIIGFLFKRWIEQFFSNKKLEKQQTGVVSDKILPTLFLTSNRDATSCNLEERNYEVTYFLTLTSFFMFWSLIASMLLDKEYRYIPLSLFALNLLIFFIYIQNKLHSGRSVSKETLFIAELDHLKSLAIKAKEFADKDDLTDGNLIIEMYTDHLQWQHFFEVGENNFYVDFGELNEQEAQDLKEKFRQAGKDRKVGKRTYYFTRYWDAKDFSVKLTILNDIATLRDRAFRDYFAYNAYLKGLIISNTSKYHQKWMLKFKEGLEMINYRIKRALGPKSETITIEKIIKPKKDNLLKDLDPIYFSEPEKEANNMSATVIQNHFKALKKGIDQLEEKEEIVSKSDFEEGKGNISM